MKISSIYEYHWEKVLRSSFDDIEIIFTSLFDVETSSYIETYRTEYDRLIQLCFRWIGRKSKISIWRLQSKHYDEFVSLFNDRNSIFFINMRIFMSFFIEICTFNEILNHSCIIVPSVSDDYNRNFTVRRIRQSILSILFDAFHIHVWVFSNK